MNKLAVIAMSALSAFVGYCGWLAYHYEGGNDNGKGYANAFYRVREPTRVAPKAVREEQAVMAAAATLADTDLRINGKKVVTNDPERHDMAHAMYRAEHSCTQNTRR